MKKILFTTLFLIFISEIQAQELITSEILQRVMYIKNGAFTGTAFFVSISNKFYVITARHLFSDSLQNSEVEFKIWQNKGWQGIKGKLLLHKNKNIDIAVIDPNHELLNDTSYNLSTKGMSISQECFFLGFPFGYKMDIDIFNGSPSPFVKKGIISASINDKVLGNRIFLDGHNNPGFSGGPVVISNANSNKKSIIGVISGYLPDNKIISTPSGDLINHENSGIVVAYSINYIFEILDKK